MKKIICFAFVLHVIFLASVFDIYFTTPIVHGIAFQRNVFSPPAKRLVLFVADGMRADTFYSLSANKTFAPFLRNIIEKTGTWGVSHTRVPTESRPGHVALIAGLYEDPSAITKAAPLGSDAFAAASLRYRRCVDYLSSGSYSLIYLAWVALPGAINIAPASTALGVIGTHKPFHHDKGWKENPVEFDSIFNRSTFTWAWGSPDILPMFSKASGDRMWTQMYAAEDEDFSGGHKSTSWLDDWVFMRFEEFMGRVARDVYHWERIHHNGIVFFLHLLASDTAGHTFKPHSWEYQKNVKLIDNGVKKVVDLLEDFYGNDGKTAYIVTADHGMTDWGSHGAGDASETQTPLVAWGAGVPRSIPSDSPACHKQSQGWPEVDDQGWDLSGVCRHDTWQADISPLMATLIGAPIPTNSIGYLHRSYLDLGAKEMAQAAFTNARHMLSQHAHRRALIEQPWACDGEGDGHWLCTLITWLPSLYCPYPPLPPEDEAFRLASISRHIDQGDYGKAVAESDELFVLASSGLKYHHRYHKTLLLAAISLSFVAWILLLLMLVIGGGGNLDDHWTRGNSGCELKLLLDLPVALLATVMAFYLFVLASPLQYYVYCLLPFALWWGIVRLTSNWYAKRSSQTGYAKHWDWCSMLSSAALIALYLAGIEILVLSFFHRWFLSLGMVGLALHPLTKLCSGSIKGHRQDLSKFFYWAASCFILGVFPFMPVIGKEVDTTLVTMAGLLFVALGMLATLIHGKGSRHLLHALTRQWPLSVQFLFLLPLATWNVGEADKSFNQNQGLPLVCQILSWILLVFSLGFPLIAQRALPQTRTSLQEVTQQLMNVCLAMAVPYTLLTVNHEGFFLLALVINVHAWVHIEINMDPQEAKTRRVSWDNLRIAYTFMFLIITAFFGTGNMASINSFDPAWVRRFLSVFSPHIMGALILAKTCIPFLLVSCAFRGVNVLLNTQTKQLFLIVLALSDTCGLHFLHLVVDEGSWMQIGSSLSHFVIQETMVVFLLLLYALSCYFMPLSASVKALHADLSASVPLPINSYDEKYVEVKRTSWAKKSKSS